MRRLLLVLLAMFIGAIIGILQPVHGQEGPKKPSFARDRPTK